MFGVGLILFMCSLTARAGCVRGPAGSACQAVMGFNAQGSGPATAGVGFVSGRNGWLAFVNQRLS
jgi:hypothetical protein